MYGVGMVVGALLATRVMRRLAFGTVIGLGPVTGFVRRGDGAHDGDCHAAARGPELLPARRRSNPVGDLDHHLAAIGDPAEPAWPGVGDQHHELWRAPGRSALGAIVGGLYSAEACLYLAVVIFGAQALVILLSPAVSLRGSRRWSASRQRLCGLLRASNMKVSDSSWPGFVPAIHVFLSILRSKTWMPGTRPGMTE